MKQPTEGAVRPREILPIPHNRTESAMPSEVREFAEMLAEIAVRQLRSQPILSQGELLHE